MTNKVSRWRNNTKRILIEAFGGKCQSCGYSVCDSALEFHNRDPSSKDFSLSRVRANPVSWSRIAAEVRKCVMLCANCHREVHAGIRDCEELTGPNPYLIAGAKAQLLAGNEHTCVACGGDFFSSSKNRVTCSTQCAAARREIVNWDSVDIPQLMSEHDSYVSVGAVLGVSDKTVRKHHLCSV